MTATDSFSATDGHDSIAFVSPYLIIGLQCLRPTAPSSRLSLLDVDRVTVGRSEQTSYDHDGRGRAWRVGLPDRLMSTHHVSIARDGNDWIAEDLGSKNGMFMAGVRAARAKLHDGDVLEVGTTFLLFRDRVERRPGEPGTLHAADADAPPVMSTLSPALWHGLRDLARIARGTSPILITGETGTGKELIARAVHELSGRAGAFSPLNCAAIPDTLIETELFGHRRGAFSGAADDHPGLFRAAAGGTVFLDEIAELAAPTQAKLLRVLQEGEVQPVGDTRRVRVDVRILAATHQDVDARMRDGRFRQDLHARIMGFRIELPPLRERREDLGILVGNILRGLGAEQFELTRDAARALYKYDWPSNVRELHHALVAAVQLADDDTIGVNQLPAAVRGVKDDERTRLADLLRMHLGNVASVAQHMGTSPGHVRRLAKRHSLDLDAFRPRKRDGSSGSQG